MPLLIYKQLSVFRKQFAWIGLLLTTAFILYGFVTASMQTEQKTTASVQLSVSNENCYSQQERDAYNYEGWQVKISREGFADQLFTVDKSGKAVVSITSSDVGQYDISIIVPNKPKARALSASINYNGLDPNNPNGAAKEQEYTEVDYAKDNKVGINFHTRWYNHYFPPPQSPYLKVSVTDVGCDEAKKEENEITVILTSHDCKSRPKWDDLKVSIGETEFDAYADTNEFGKDGEARQKDIKISPGKYEVSVRSTDFPKTIIQEADTFQMFSKSKGAYTKDVGTYPADDSGLVTVTLDKSSWKKSGKFLGLALRIAVWGNCENPKTDPKEFAIVRVKAISGTVEAKEPFNWILDRKSGTPKSILKKSNVDDKYRRGTIIKTGADGLIVLESEYKHTITIENSTEIKLDTIMTAEGRRQLRALVEKGKIKIERQGAKDDSSETTVETKTAIVNSTKTIYSVSYNETTNQTTVGVEEGQVEVFPEDETLQPVTLEAHQQVQVSDKSISAVTPYSGETGSKPVFIIVIVGIVIAALIGLLVLIAGIFIVYRIKNRATV